MGKTLSSPQRWLNVTMQLNGRVYLEKNDASIAFYTGRACIKEGKLIKLRVLGIRKRDVINVIHFLRFLRTQKVEIDNCDIYLNEVVAIAGDAPRSYCSELSSNCFKALDLLFPSRYRILQEIDELTDKLKDFLEPEIWFCGLFFYYRIEAVDREKVLAITKQLAPLRREIYAQNCPKKIIEKLSSLSSLTGFSLSGETGISHLKLPPIINQILREFNRKLLALMPALKEDRHILNKPDSRDLAEELDMASIAIALS